MNRALIALLLAISSAASAHGQYEWTQEQPASKSYRWELVTDMCAVKNSLGEPLLACKVEAWTDQQPDGICVIYSTISEDDAEHKWINPRDGLSIRRHELRHCRGEYHIIKES